MVSLPALEVSSRFDTIDGRLRAPIVSCLLSHNRGLFMRMLYSALIRLDLKNGNDGRGNRWFSSAKIRKQYSAYLRAHGLVRQPFDRAVSLRIVRIIGPRQKAWDEDSILRGQSKELIDALCECGWFVDDRPKYIKQVLGSQEVNREIGPAIRVEVYDEFFFKP